MNKAFDTSALFADLKAAGLPVLEQDVKMLTSVVFKWAKDSLVLEAVAQPMLAIAIPLVDQLEKIVLAAEEKLAPPPAA